jgi:hypothetical protein
MSRAPAVMADELDKCNVVWNTPSANLGEAMPIGNGDIGLNVWVEPSGDLCFSIGKTDAWDENLRLLKLNKVRIKLNPPLVTGKGFRQELKLRDGAIEIQDGRTQLRVWVDANHPVICIDSTRPIAATLEPWRKEKREIRREGGEYFATGFTNLPAFSYPDVLVKDGWYHRNVVSPWLASLKLQKLEAIAQTERDPLLNRTMGGILRGNNSRSLRIHVLTAITDTPEQWLAAVESQANAVEKTPAAQCWQEHCRWWDQFWNRSWIYVAGQEKLTRGYTLQRWMNACAGRGAFPIKFNGSIFVWDGPFDADYRRWGGGYWFQNTRLAYWPMLMAGDFDLMQPWFAMYMKALPARKLAAKTYYGHEGAFYPETMSFWGNFLDQADLGYGTNRTGRPDGQTDNAYIRRYWSGGLELVAVMLDYYDLTQDETFRDATLVPFADEILTFFDRHWKRGEDGKIRFHPSQALETWWDCTNPTPEVAGLRYVIPRLQKITGSKRFQKTLDDLPALPLSADGTRIEPAAKYASCQNSENAELYAVFPYRLYGVGKPDLEVGRGTFRARRNAGTGGWRQDAIQAALLGMTDVAQKYVVQNASAHGRFPAYFGPNFDWVPDQDHGGVMMAALQRMLLQSEGEKIYLLPAWPKDWDVSFKLHAPGRTTVECTYRAGKIEQLKVTPESRRKDIVER